MIIDLENRRKFASGPDWTPEEIATALWLDAADTGTITESGGLVSQWDDKSGNNNHAIQPIGADQPMSGFSLNGLNAINFNGGNDSVYRIMTGNENWQDFYMLMRWDTASPNFVSYHGIFGGYDATGTDIGLGVLAGLGGQNILAAGWWDNLFLNGTQITSAPYKVLPEMQQASIISASADNPISVNGFKVSRDRLNNNRSWIGIICEVVAFNQKLNLDNRQRMEGYLAHKWATTALLPALHPYKNQSPKA